MELWDAYDQDGRLLGFDLVRGEPMPEGVWHMVVEVYAVTTGGQVLVTKRHPDKPWGNHWEITGGAVLKGETPVEGALRELREETGIQVTADQLHPVYIQARRGIDGLSTIYNSFLVFFAPEEQVICLQEGETVDYRLLSYEAYQQFVRTEEFTTPVGERFLDHQALFDRLVAEYVNEK